MLGALVDSGHIKEATAERLDAARVELIEKVACDLVVIGFAQLGDADDLEKRAGLIDMLKGLKILGQDRVNPDLRKVDPNVYNALQTAYQAGAENARKKFPHSAMSLGSPWRTAAALMGLAMGARAVGEGVAGMKGYLHRRKVGRDVDAAKKQMFEKFPELRDNESAAQETFDILSSYAPAMASNPVVAGTFVQTSLGRSDSDVPYIGPAEVKMLLENQMSAERIRDLADPGARRIGEGVKSDVGNVVSGLMAGNVL